MSDGELHAALGLHRGRRALVVAVVLVLGALGVLTVLPGEREPEPLAPQPPAPTMEAGRAANPPRQSTRRKRPRPPPAPAPADEVEVPAPPVSAAVVESPAPPPPAPGPARSEAEVPVIAAVVEAPKAPPPPAPPPPEEASELESAPPAPPEEEPSPDGHGERIARAIAAQKRAAVRTCFEHELKEQPRLAGNVIVELDLAPPAQVSALRISDDLDRPRFTQCVTAAMQSVRFEALDEELSVRVPYVLSPAHK